MKRLALAIAVGLVVTASSLTPVARSAAADSDLMARAAHFRLSFGLRSDATYVQQSVTDATAFPDLRFGVPLTSAEGAEIQRRIDVQQAATPAAEWAAGQPGFGGWYIDQLDGGTPVILVVGDTAAFGKSFAQHLTSSVSYRVAAVANSQQSLQALEDRIWADRADLARVGIDLQGVALDIPVNAVRVEVVGLTDSSAATLKARYGAVEAVENVPAETDSCSRTNCPPSKGGLQITDVQHPAYSCTLGFNAKLYSGGAPVILTAGHCLTEGDPVVSDSWSHAGTTLGHGLISLWGPTYDAGLITQGSISGDDNLVFWSSASDIPHVVAIASLSGMPVGTPACRSAFMSGYYCGQVTAIEQIKNVDNVSVSHMWVEDFDAIPGDSGAPVGLETASGRLLAYGTHSDSTSANPPGGSGWFEPIVYSAVGLNNAGYHYILCTLATC